MALIPLAETLKQLSEAAAGASVDACTLNNALNVLQIALLVALLRWVRQP